MSTKLIAVVYTPPKSAWGFIIFLTILVGLLTPQQVRADDPPSICITTSCHATFDIEALHENYFDDWRIEADAADVNGLELRPKSKATHNFDIEADAAEVNTLESRPKIKPAPNFNVEWLRQHYFDDWQIEADVTD